MLSVPEESKWDQIFFCNSGETCLGFGSCEYCNEEIYPKRSRYLKSWIDTYLKNIDHIYGSEATMPHLSWKASNNAKTFNLGEFHKSKCQEKENVDECNCNTAWLLRSM